MAGNADEFRIPTIAGGLPPSVSYGELMQATDTNERAASERRNDFGQAVEDLAKGLGGYIYGAGENSADAKMRNDVAALGEKWDNLSSDTISQHKYTWAPSENAEAGGGAVGQESNVLRMSP